MTFTGCLMSALNVIKVFQDRLKDKKVDRYAGAERVISGGSGCHSGVPISAYRAPPKAYLSVPFAFWTMVNHGEAAEEYVPVFRTAVPAVMHYSSDSPARFVSLG